MKKILIIIIFCLALTPGVALSDPVTLPIEPKDRPNDCGDQCVTFSEDGYTIHLWYKSDRDKKDEVFNYVAISAWIPSQYIGNQYIYKSTERDFYIYANMRTGFKVERHYKTSEGQKVWDDTPVADQFYKIIGDAKIPSGERSGSRYSFRIVVTGKVLFESQGTSAPAKNAKVRVTLDNEYGPPVEEVQTNENGEFEISKAGWGRDELVWLNQDIIKKIFFRVGYENNGLKYETKPAIEKNFDDATFRPHQEDKTAKVLDNFNITLTPSNIVDDFSAPFGQSELTPVQEITGSLNWEEAVMNKVVCMLRDAFITVFYYEAKIAAWFLRRNY